MSKHFFALAALAAILGFFVLKSSEQSSTDALIVGLQSGYPPFEYVDAKGTIVGFDVDVAKLLATKLDKRLVIKDMEFEGEILALKQGKIDLIMSGMNITPQRLQEIAMIPYHGEKATSLSLIFWKTVPPGISSLEDIALLNHPSISVEVGAFSELFLGSYPSIHVKSFQGALAPLMDVKLGKSLANLVEKDVADFLAKKHPEVKILEVPIPPTETIFGFGIGIKKENDSLIQQISIAIQELKHSGELQKLEEKWFMGEGV